MQPNINTNKNDKEPEIDNTGIGKGLSNVFHSSIDTITNLNKKISIAINDALYSKNKRNLSQSIKRLFFDHDNSSNSYTFNIVRSMLIFGIILFVFLSILKFFFTSGSSSESLIVYEASQRPSNPVISELSQNKDTNSNNSSGNSVVEQLIKKHNDPKPKTSFEADTYIANNNNHKIKISPETEEYIERYSKRDTRSDLSHNHTNITSKEEEDIYTPTIVFGSNVDNSKTNKPVDNSGSTPSPENNNTIFKFKPMPGLRLKVKLEYDLITSLNQPAIAIPCDSFYTFPPNTRFYGTVSGNYEENIALYFSSYTLNDTKYEIKALAAQDNSTTISAEKIGELDFVEGAKSGSLNTLKNLLPSSNDLLSSFIKNAGSSVLSSVRTSTSYNVYKINKGSTFYVVFLPEN